MTALLAHADTIATQHQQARITAVHAENLLLGLGFINIKFGRRGVASAQYLGITYNLGAPA